MPLNERRDDSLFRRELTRFTSVQDDREVVFRNGSETRSSLIGISRAVWYRDTERLAASRYESNPGVHSGQFPRMCSFLRMSQVQILALVLVAGIVGCSGSDSSENLDGNASIAEEERAATEPQSVSGGPLIPHQSNSDHLTRSFQAGQTPLPPAPMPMDSQSIQAGSFPSATAGSVQLRSDLTAPELVSLLGEIDREMRSLINGQSGITDPNSIKSEVERVVELKRVASERLMNDPDADEASRVKGSRGYLQAMSHLASMGDLASAEKLQAFAERSIDDVSPELRSDSQLVLIGFAIERLRHGKDGAAQRVLELTKNMARNDNPVDVATLMVMGQAKDTLIEYERMEEAAEVRDLILERFANSDDAEVARMAAIIASSGFSQNDENLQRLDSLRAAIVQPQDDDLVTAAQWTSAVKKVFEKPIDLLTVQFLAGMSLEAEAIGRKDIAEATYELLSGEIANRPDAIGREARTAIQAKMNRADVIGQTFNPDLPSVDGQPLSMDDYEGKVVLMPFWSSAFPESLAVLPHLQSIQDQNPSKVAIVGVNLDLAGTDVLGFMRQNDLTFESFRCESDPSTDITNEVAYRFGAVSLLFVAILDPAGKVAFVDFSGSDLTEKVEKLIR